MIIIITIITIINIIIIIIINYYHYYYYYHYFNCHYKCTYVYQVVGKGHSKIRRVEMKSPVKQVELEIEIVKMVKTLGPRTISFYPPPPWVYLSSPFELSLSPFPRTMY